MRFTRIVSIQKEPEPQHVYDISMQDSEDPSFIANSFVVHNSYASAESAYSVFLEQVDAYRNHMTESIFYKKLFPLIAVANRLTKEEGKKEWGVQEWLYKTSNREKLLTPKLHWHKDLSAKGADNIMDMLEKVQEKTNLNIPLQTWLAAAGIDKDTLIKDQKIEQSIIDSLGLKKGDEDGRMEAKLLPQSLKLGARKRLSVLDRKFEDSVYATTRTGKKKAVHGERAKQKDLQWKIAKIAEKAAKDPEYRQRIKKQRA